MDGTDLEKTNSFSKNLSKNAFFVVDKPIDIVQKNQILGLVPVHA